MVLKGMDRATQESSKNRSSTQHSATIALHIPLAHASQVSEKRDMLLCSQLLQLEWTEEDSCSRIRAGKKKEGKD